MARRSGFWIDTRVELTVAVGTMQILSLMTNVTASQSRRGWTCVRTLIGYDIAYTVHDAGEGSMNWFAGIGVASQEAFAVGQTAIANPSVETDHPTRGWMYRAAGRVFGFAADQPAVYSHRVDMDIRGKRKLDNGEMFLAVETGLNEGATTTISVDGFIRQYWLDE